MDRKPDVGMRRIDVININTRGIFYDYTTYGYLVCAYTYYNIRWPSKNTTACWIMHKLKAFGPGGLERLVNRGPNHSIFYNTMRLILGDITPRRLIQPVPASFSFSGISALYGRLLIPGTTLLVLKVVEK